MNWDIIKSKHTINSNFESEPLTITGIKKTEIRFFNNIPHLCYVVKVEEDVTYWKQIGGEKTTKKEINTFQRTRKNHEQISDDSNNNNAFYYFTHHFRSKNSVKIPFKGYRFNKDLNDIAFFLGEEANKIIREEKERWDNAGFTKEEDLKIENLGLVDAKWNALEKDIDGNNWNPSLKPEERKLISDAQTVEKVLRAQIKIALLREQKNQDNKQNDEIEKLKKQLLDIRKKDLNVRLVKFRTDLSVRENDLQAKYASLDYQQILDKSLTLDNLNQLENTLRTVICICATEIAKQEVDKKVNSNETHALLTYLNSIKNAWSQTVSEISKENNPLYLEITDQHLKYRQQVEDSIEDLQKQQPNPILEDLSATKKQAKQDIGEALTKASLSEADIISDYQGYAEKIEKLNDSQAVKDFVQTMIAYIVRQEAAYRELREALKNDAEISNESKDKEEVIFERCRQARKKLYIVVEKTSPEAQQAYRVMNKNSEVTNSINKLYGPIEAYLAKYKEKIKNDPSKKEFLQALEERGYGEGTPRFDLYCTIWGIVERYVKDKLGKEVDVYPYVEVENTNGHTGWKGHEWPKYYNKKFDFNINFESINGVSLDKNFAEAEVMLISTVGHELSHDKTMKEEAEGSLKNRQPQIHSEYFWKNFLYRFSSDETEPTATYVHSCLSPEKRKKLKDYVFDPSVPNHSHIRYRYFPNSNYKAIEVPENERKKKKFSKDQKDIVDIWENIWTRLFKHVDSSISDDKWTEEEIKKYWVKAWLKQPHETKNGEEKGYRAYIYYKDDIPENLKNLIDSEFSDKSGWARDIIHEDKIKEISEIICANVGCGTCGKVESQQTAQIIHNPMNNPNK